MPGGHDPVLEFIRLMWSVDHELQRVSKRMVSRIGLTAPQRLAIRFIGRNADVTSGALAELLHMHPGTVSGIVRHLEDVGLVLVARSTADTRRIHLRLTARGRSVNRQRKGTVEAAVRRAVGELTSEQLEVASRILQRLAIELAAE